MTLKQIMEDKRIESVKKVNDIYGDFEGMNVKYRVELKAGYTFNFCRDYATGDFFGSVKEISDCMNTIKEC